MRVGLSGLTMAEYFRDEKNQDVLLFIDNIYRAVQAYSEISAMENRMPIENGYPATLDSDVSEIEERINKVREKGYFPEEDILKNIKRIDRERRDYYRYYTGKSWENLENYDLMINTTKLSYDDMVECVVDYLKMRGILAK